MFLFIVNSSGVTYEIRRGGTQKGGDKLIDSLGFTYNVKKVHRIFLSKSRFEYICIVCFSETGVTYEIVRGGTTRGRDKLIDSLGFAYNMKVLQILSQSLTLIFPCVWLVLLLFL